MSPIDLVQYVEGFTDEKIAATAILVVRGIDWDEGLDPLASCLHQYLVDRSVASGFTGETAAVIPIVVQIPDGGSIESAVSTPEEAADLIAALRIRFGLGVAK